MNELAVILIGVLAAARCAPTNEATSPCGTSENMSPKCEKLIKHLLVVLKELVQNHDEGCFLNGTKPTKETSTITDTSDTTERLHVADLSSDATDLVHDTDTTVPSDTTDPVLDADPSGTTVPSDTTDSVPVTDPADTTTTTKRPRPLANLIVRTTERAQTPSTTTDAADATMPGSAGYDTTTEDDTTTQESVEVDQLVTTSIPEDVDEERVTSPRGDEDHSSTKPAAASTEKLKCDCGKISCEHLEEYYVPVFRFDSDPSSGGKPIFCQK